ncbi:MAG TPA: hypothetical protein VKB86_12705 [Pyrinomonadaceae bacterium]|nr:hypothetical protein [Pyrinomonadaceae bacterium]
MLLDNVCEFVRQQPAPLCRLRRILPFAKYDVAPYGVRPRVDRPCRLRCATICMHAHASEVAPEARLEEGPL